MSKLLKMLRLLLFLTVFSLVTNPANAWYMKLTGVVGDIAIGTYYTQSIFFHSDTGTDNLNDFFLSVDYDQTKVDYVGTLFMDYDDGGIPFPKQIWDGGVFGVQNDGNVVWDFNASEPVDYPFHFFPPAGDTLMATIYWSPLVTGNDVTVSVWTNGPWSDFISVDGTTYWYPPVQPALASLAEYRDLSGNTDNLAPVPVPAAVWLLGSGLLGLVGLHRRSGR